MSSFTMKVISYPLQTIIDIDLNTFSNCSGDKMSHDKTIFFTYVTALSAAILIGRAT